MEIVREQEEQLVENQESQATQPEFKFVMIGGNEPLVNDYFIQAMKKYEDQISVFELTEEEMKFIISSRADKKAEEVSLNYLEDPKNKERVDMWVRMLIENHIKNVIPKQNQIPLLQSIIDGNNNLIFDKKSLKSASKLSWKNYEELFSTLELFGLVQYENEEQSKFYLILDRAKIIENQLAQVRQILSISLNKLSSLEKNPEVIKKEKTKIKNISTKLSTIIRNM